MTNALNVAEANFALGGVYVEIHKGRVNVQEEEGEWVLSARQNCGKSPVQGLQEVVILNSATVYEYLGMTSIRARQSGVS